jgi:hypothetical protein
MKTPFEGPGGPILKVKPGFNQPLPTKVSEAAL